jgi:hypothetical protein
MVVFGGNWKGHIESVSIIITSRTIPLSLYWVPFLKRQFNNTITFFDAVNVQLAVNDPSYTNFRLQMETMLSALQSYVGGHMYSDLSSYDLIFLTIMAYNVY